MEFLAQRRFIVGAFSSLLCVGLLSGCASLVGSVTRGFADNLSAAILDNPDLEMVRDGAPSYLILIDSLIQGSPDNAYLLQQSATLHSAYAGAFVSEPERARLLATKAKVLALQAACVKLRDGCDLDKRPYKPFERWTAQLTEKNVPTIYTLATSWAGWIQAHSDDFTAIADLGKVKALMARVAELSPEYENGNVYLYLGVFETLLPPAMGGKPELGRSYFEKSIELSEDRNLLAKVMFAEQYGRLVFDRALHDELLQEVMDAPLEQPGLTLMNAVAKEQAQVLLETADEYF